MSVAVALTALLLSQAPSPPERQMVGPISFEPPPGWRRTFRFGTVRFDDPLGGGYVLVDTSQVLRATAMAPEECRNKAVSNLGGGKGWVGYMVGGQPAANQVVVETSAVGNSIVTSRWVGCDGLNVWSMLFEADGAHYQRVQPFIGLVMRTLRYENSPGNETAAPDTGPKHPDMPAAPAVPSHPSTPAPPLPRSR